MSTTRHIYNSSGGIWTFQNLGTNPNGNYGNVWFSGGGTGTAQNGPWVLQPNQTAEIDYTTTAGSTAGNWQITDANNNSNIFNYQNDLNLSTPPYIQHSGNTGPANLNEPANGDISMVGNTW